MRRENSHCRSEVTKCNERITLAEQHSRQADEQSGIAGQFLRELTRQHFCRTALERSWRANHFRYSVSEKTGEKVTFADRTFGKLDRNGRLPVSIFETLARKSPLLVGFPENSPANVFCRSDSQAFTEKNTVADQHS